MLFDELREVIKSGGWWIKLASAYSIKMEESQRWDEMRERGGLPMARVRKPKPSTMPM